MCIATPLQGAELEDAEEAGQSEEEQDRLHQHVVGLGEQGVIYSRYSVVIKFRDFSLCFHWDLGRIPDIYQGMEFFRV